MQVIHSRGGTGMRLSEAVKREIKQFKKVFARQPEILVLAPGRANIIGEHTDYTGGLVFPAAIDTRIDFLVSGNGSNTVRLYSDTYQESCEFNLDEKLKRTHHWSDYIKGVVCELKKAGYQVDGFNALIGGDLPIGSGLSSSAAFEMAVSEGCAQLFGYAPMDPEKQIKLCRKAENQFVGVSCGIMDQFIIRMGRKHHGLYLDCRSLEYELIPIPSDDLVFVIVYSGVKRGLGATAYHERQKQCERGRLFFNALNKSLRSLRDVNEDLLQVSRENMDPLIFKRCRHVITENTRVKRAVEALRKPDMVLFGELMNLSHESCKNDFEVSCEELDLLVDLARNVPGVLGSRMTGAGFGGCTISLVARNRVDEFERYVGNLYNRTTGIVPEFYITHAEDGVSAVRL
ncbi:MAG: galactokinase [Candidatus Glassbacteria bacterium]|nr:galactokinase [Candidatus Glassbacteria bacterium]